jgi:hypothetical protein
VLECLRAPRLRQGIAGELRKLLPAVRIRRKMAATEGRFPFPFTTQPYKWETGNAGSRSVGSVAECRIAERKLRLVFPQRWQEVRCGGDDIANFDRGVRVDRASRLQQQRCRTVCRCACGKSRACATAAIRPT